MPDTLPDDGARLTKLERTVGDHDTVIGEFGVHLEKLATDFTELKDNVGALSMQVGRIVGWFSDKRTKYLAGALVLILFGPNGVQHLKELLGL